MAAVELGNPVEVILGNFAAGERPDALSYQFLDAQGSPIDLSTQSNIQFDFGVAGSGTYASGVGTAILDAGDPDNSTVLYPWTATDMASKGHYEGRIWVTLPNLEYASVRILWYVGDAIKAP